MDESGKPLGRITIRQILAALSAEIETKSRA